MAQDSGRARRPEQGARDDSRRGGRVGGRAGGSEKAGRPAGETPRGSSTRGGRGQGTSARPETSSRGGVRRPDREAPPTARRDEPPLPDDVTGAELDRAVRAELSTLATLNGEAVGRHLVMAGRLLDEDPETAYAHAVAAKGRAGRVAAVREAVGLAAYLTGRFAEALAELRAARRISGDQSSLPVMADCERGLGRPEKALAMAAGPDVTALDQAGRVEMVIVASGARRDLGQPEAAGLLLKGAELRPDRRKPWSSRLFYAYAEAMHESGNQAEALTWFGHAAEADHQGQTDADERLAELSGVTITDLDDE